MHSMPCRLTAFCRQNSQNIGIDANITTMQSYVSWYRSCSDISGAAMRCAKSVKASLYSTAERRVPELIPALGSQPAVDVSHKPGGRLPLLSGRPAVTLATLKRLLPISLLGEQRHDGCGQFD